MPLLSKILQKHSLNLLTFLPISCFAFTLNIFVMQTEASLFSLFISYEVESSLPPLFETIRIMLFNFFPTGRTLSTNTHKDPKLQALPCSVKTMSPSDVLRGKDNWTVTLIYTVCVCGCVSSVRMCV